MMLFVKPNQPTDDGEDDSPRGAAGDSFLLAHLSDPHLTSLSGVHIADLLNKRLFGYLSWLHKRRHRHSPHILDALLRDLAEVAPDHVALTGDLTNLGLPDEFHQAALWLGQLGAPERVTVVPGNHDTCISLPWQATFSAWAPYLAGDGDSAAVLYPILRERGPMALIGLSTARPSMPFLAVGSLGSSQLARLEELLEETGRRGLLRIVLLHHPPVPGSIAWRKRLTDAALFAEVLARKGAELILHGHAHVSMERELVTGMRSIPVFGVPSASDSGSNPQSAARYHLFRFERRTGGWMLLLTARAYSRAESRFVIAQEKELFLSDHAR